jgi:hypothetical protein
MLIQADAEDVDFFADEKRLFETAAVAVQRMAGALPTMVFEIL